MIYVAVEDSWKYTIVPRLMAAGADLTKVYRAEVEAVEGETVTLSLPSDNVSSRKRSGSTRLPSSPSTRSCPRSATTLTPTSTGRCGRPSTPSPGWPTGPAASSAGSPTSTSPATDASSLITASGAFKDVARFIFAFARDDEDGTQVITQTKNSLGRSDLPSLAYRIITATVPTGKGDASVGRIVIDGETDRSVRDLLSGQDGQERDAKARAEAFLRSALAMARGQART